MKSKSPLKGAAIPAAAPRVRCGMSGSCADAGAPARIRPAALGEGSTTTCQCSVVHPASERREGQPNRLITLVEESVPRPYAVGRGLPSPPTRGLKTPCYGNRSQSPCREHSESTRSLQHGHSSRCEVDATAKSSQRTAREDIDPGDSVVPGPRHRVSLVVPREPAREPLDRSAWVEDAAVQRGYIKPGDFADSQTAQSRPA